MKIRNGFVSNSSSSSFILGCFKIKDVEKCEKFFKRHGEDLEQITTKQSCSPYCKILGQDLINYKKESRVFTIDSFEASIDIYKTDINPTDQYLIVNFVGNEGDEAFKNSFDDDDDYDINYDIDEDFFQGTFNELLIKEIYKGDDMLQSIYWEIGASRNG